MGFNWHRALGGLLTGGPTGAVAGGMSGGGGHGPDPTQDPYGGGAQFDANGYPSRMPYGPHALDYQFIANRQTEQRRQALWGDVQNTMRQGMDLMQSYRPGGAAALASGMYGQSAGLYAQQAMSLESPDLLIGYRAQKQDEATKEAKRANRINQIMGGLHLAAGIAGAAAGAPGAGAGGQPQTAPAQAGAVPGAPQASPAQGTGPYGGFGTGAAMAGLSGVPPPGAQPTPAAGFMGGDNPLYGGGGSGPAFQGSGPGGAAPSGGGGPMQRQGGGGGGAGPGGAAPGGFKGQAGGGEMPFGADGNFTSNNAAASAQRTMPHAAQVLHQEWAEDPIRKSGTAAMVRSARIRLLTELQLQMAY